MEKERHPKGLFVLFFTEMWERFGFYSMLAMFVLYLRNDKQGFSWTAESATELYSWYLMAVYASPLLGGWIADRGLGYRNSVLIGGVFFMIGYFLLAIPTLTAVFVSLALLVIGNGFFKPNVSAMVGQLYPEGSRLKDRAYNIFYMGINIGALLAPINAEILVHRVGFNIAFAVAGVGMIFSVLILWSFRRQIDADRDAAHAATAAAHTVREASQGEIKPNPIDRVPDSRRITALLVIFAVAIVFWMVFHQNGSTLTYWADDNTSWNVSGIIANAINPFFVVTLTFPVVWMWGWMARQNREPSIPTKMAMGMCLSAVSFAILYFAAKSGETQEVRSDMLAAGGFRIVDRTLDKLAAAGVPADVLEKLRAKDDKGKFKIKGRKYSPDSTFNEALETVKADATTADTPEQDKKLLNDAKFEKDQPLTDGNFATALDELVKSLKAKGLSDATAERMTAQKDRKFTGEEKLTRAVTALVGEPAAQYTPQIVKQSFLFRVSPLWLIIAYAVMTLGELMFSPMGLSLVSKVAPIRLRGLMMGGWFVATAIGNKLVVIGVLWDRWLQSDFFILLSVIAFAMGLVLILLLRPLNKAMPGV